MFDMAKYLPILMQFLIAVPQLVKTAETAFSGQSGSGQAKKDLVTTIVNQGLTTYQQVAVDKLPDDQVTAIQQSVGLTVDATVAVMNSVHGVLGDKPVVS